MTAPRLLFVVNNPAFFLSHRLPLALAAQRAGYEVHVATMAGDSVSRIEGYGLTHHAIPMTRSGKNPVQELRTVWALYQLFRRVRPDVVHLVTIKPVLYGGIAARLAGVPAMVSAISGLGFVFVAKGAKAALVRQVVAMLYRLALGHRNSRIVFQNGNDRDVLQGLGAVRDEQVVMIRGSGVNLSDYAAVAEPPPPVVALMVARLLRDKGLQEFVEAARILRREGINVRMRLAGGIDPGNPASVTQADVDAWQQEGIIEALGERSDIAALYAASHIAVLPSYREGLPKSLIEAAACGRAVVTTDVPGCRDAIEPDTTGLLVPSHDAPALAAAIGRLVDDNALRQKMGHAGRVLAEREFDIDDVCRKHLDIYQTLLDQRAR
ncbi:glycosyltransferase family 4 protein [Bordetella genomosp. 4]|uniref:Glycosyltransferase family 1 protein n=1 Tax=Bordetella genomosp. 4 TaxID=463044 RepID=A0A261TLI2_9BORD|nr:glycosyltransferase family 4 protein [Bordetella genomosp. 4]OZI50548.1 glycosyltransferase family 1 protein [Bordetella genomosp. 4]